MPLGLQHGLSAAFEVLPPGFLFIFVILVDFVNCV